MHCDSMAPFGGAVTCDTCAPFDPAGGVAMKLAHDVTLVQVSAMPPAGGRTTVLVAAPAAPHCRGGWYIADAEMRDILGVVYISKRAAVASIRAMPAAANAGHPLFIR
jgi:hypothetical protein